MSASRKLLVAIAASFLVVGVIEPHLPRAGQPMNEIGVVHGFILAVLMFSWCKADAAARNIKPPPGAALAVGVLVPIGLPYYLFRTMPWRTAAVMLLKSIGFLAGCVAIWSGAMWVSGAFAL